MSRGLEELDENYSWIAQECIWGREYSRELA
jgi:hypothetical protein